jgi:hypothetical protein
VATTEGILDPGLFVVDMDIFFFVCICISKKEGSK